MKKIILGLPISGTKIQVPFQAICSLTNKKFGGGSYNRILSYQKNDTRVCGCRKSDK